MTEALAFHIVRGMGASRLLVGCFLPFCGWNGWWSVAASLFIAAFLTDMIDGAMARHWEVTSRSGERLDTVADAVLTGGGLLAVSLANVWHWWVPIFVAAAYVSVRLLEPRLRGNVAGLEDIKRSVRGELVGWIIVLQPTVNIVLSALLSVALLRQATGIGYGYLLLLVVAGGACLCICKWHRMQAHFQYALQESDDVKYSISHSD